VGSGLSSSTILYNYDSIAVVNGKLYQNNYKVIDENADLDDLQDKSKIYTCTTNATAQTFTHCPTAKAFTMEVLPMATAQLMQKITDIEGNIYTRYSNGDATSWYGWYKCTATAVV
jgi:hypothetical protein